LHFTPAILSYLYMFKFYFFYSADEKRLVDMGKINDFDVFSNILLITFIISGIKVFIFKVISFILTIPKKSLATNFFLFWTD